MTVGGRRGDYRVTFAVLALVWAMRGLVRAGDVAPQAWQRFLDIHLTGLRTDHAGLRATPPHNAAAAAASISDSGRHLDSWTTPGSTSSSPSK